MLEVWGGRETRTLEPVTPCITPTGRPCGSNEPGLMSSGDRQDTQAGLPVAVGGGTTATWSVGRRSLYSATLLDCPKFRWFPSRTGVKAGDLEAFSPGCRPCFSRLYKVASWVADSQRHPFLPRRPSTLS